MLGFHFRRTSPMHMRDLAIGCQSVRLSHDASGIDSKLITVGSCGPPAPGSAQGLYSV